MMDVSQPEEMSIAAETVFLRLNTAPESCLSL